MTKKKNFLVFLLLILIYSFTNVQSVRLENYLQRQIEGYLSRMLPSNSYFLTVSVNANINRTQEVKNETINNYSKEENSSPPPIPPIPTKPTKNQNEEEFEILPGLEKLYNENYIDKKSTVPVPVPNRIPTKSFKENNNQTSREYNYVDNLEIQEISVQISFSDTLNQELVQTVKNIISSKFDATYAEKANIIYSTVNLNQTEDPVAEVLPQPIPENTNQQFSAEQRNEKDFAYYLDKYNSLIYLLVSIIVFIILLLLFIFFAWLFFKMINKKEEKTQVHQTVEQPMEKKNDNSPIPLNLHNYSEEPFQEPVKKKENLDVKEKENRFLDNVLKEPLLSRKYFMSLTDDDKNELLSSFVSTATRGVFRDIANDQSLGTEDIFGKDFDSTEVEEIRNKVFSKHIDGINQYIKIYSPQMRDVFSKLSFFSENEIKTLYSNLGITSAVIIAKNVDSQKMVPYLNQLDEQKRENFLKEFNNERELSQDEMDEFKKKLKFKVDELAKNIFIRKADNKFVKRKLLESSVDKKKFLEKIKHNDPDFYNEFKSLTVDFTDFSAEGDAIFNRVIQTAENEEITLALIGIKDESLKSRMLASLPEVRRKFIEGFVSSRQSSVTKEEIQDAQNQLLDIYRGFII